MFEQDYKNFYNEISIIKLSHDSITHKSYKLYFSNGGEYSLSTINENLNLSLLKEAINYDILDMSTDELLKLINMTKKQRHEQELLQAHLDNFYHIWTSNKGAYISYLPSPDSPKGRKSVSATTLEKLERKIIDFYLELEQKKEEEVKKAQEEEEKNKLSTLRKLYPVWLKYKGLETTATTYVRRIDTDWKKYYLNDPIIDMDIQTYTKAQLKEWALTAIRQNGLTKTQYYNMSVIIRQALDYATDLGLIKENMFNQFTVDAKLFRKKKKPDDYTQVFLKTERPLIEAEAWQEFEEKGCTSALAIPLAFQIGVRLGELVAIKDTDISSNGKYIHIQRMAQKLERQKSDGTWYPAIWTTVEHAKTSAGDREVYLPEEARRIIKIILDANQENGWHDDGFLFIHGEKRITPRAVDTRIRKYCNHININRKSTHKIRKSYISSLLDAGININQIRLQVGHEDERTTLHNYAFNRATIAENEADLEKALAC